MTSPPNPMLRLTRRLGGSLIEPFVSLDEDLRSGIRAVQELLGNSDVKATVIYAHVLNRESAGVRSPVDGL